VPQGARGPVPVGELTLRSEVTRPGRSVELVEAVLTAGGRTPPAAPPGGSAAPPAPPSRRADRRPARPAGPVRYIIVR